MSVVPARLAMPESLIRAGNPAAVTLIQNASVSTSPPRRVGGPGAAVPGAGMPSGSSGFSESSTVSRRTRMFAHRLDRPEHHRWSPTVAGHEIGSITSITVRRTIQNGSVRA